MEPPLTGIGPGGLSGLSGCVRLVRLPGEETEEVQLPGLLVLMVAAQALLEQAVQGVADAIIAASRGGQEEDAGRGRAEMKNWRPGGPCRPIFLIGRGEGAMSREYELPTDPEWQLRLREHAAR